MSFFVFLVFIISASAFCSVAASTSSSLFFPFIAFQTTPHQPHLFSPAEDYHFTNCSLEKMRNHQQHHHQQDEMMTFDLIMIHQSRSAKLNSSRTVFCFDNSDTNDESKAGICRKIAAESENFVTTAHCHQENPHSQVDITESITTLELLSSNDVNRQQDEEKFVMSSSGKEIKQRRAEQQSEEFPPSPPKYVSYHEIVRRMQKLEKNYPSLIQVFTLPGSSTTSEDSAKTANGNMIYGAKLSTTLKRGGTSSSSSSSHKNLINDLTKREIVLIGGMHAREHIAMAVTVSLLESLVSLLHLNKKSRLAISYFEWIIIPCLNPDGYEYSRSTSSRRFWRKNRRRLDERDSRFFGVDLNRNFPFQWGLDSGSSGHYWFDTYRGPHAASEVETKALMNLLVNNQNVISSSGSGNQKHSLAALFSLHNYGGAYLIPPGYATNVRTETFSLTKTLLDDSIEEYHRKLLGVESPNGETSFFTATEAWNLYPVSGELTDYFHQKFAQVPSAVVELRPVSGYGNFGFLLDESKIPNSVFEQTMTMIHLASTIRNVLIEKNSLDDSNTTTDLWYRQDQNNASSIINISQTLLNNRVNEDEDGDGVKDYLDPCLLQNDQNHQNSNTDKNIMFASYLSSNQNALRAKYFLLQNERMCIAPWLMITSDENKKQVSNHIFIHGKYNNDNDFLNSDIGIHFWNSIFSSASSHTYSSLRDKDISIERTWNASAPSVIDYSIDREEPSSNNIVIIKTVPIILLVRSRKNDGFCASREKQHQHQQLLSTNNLMMGFSKLYSCESDTEQHETKLSLLLSSSSFSSFKIEMEQVEETSNPSNNNVFSFSSSSSSSSISYQQQESDFCSVRVRFSLSSSSSSNNMMMIQEEILNDFVSSFGLHVYKSMDLTARSLACNSEKVAEAEFARVVGMQVRFKKFDENILGVKSSAFGLETGKLSLCVIFVLTMFVLFSLL